MGSGAPKRVDSISTTVMVDILAREGMAHDSLSKFSRAVTEVLNGNDDPEVWRELTILRERTFRDIQNYTIAVRNLERSQNKG